MMCDSGYGYDVSIGGMGRLFSFGISVIIVVIAIILVYYFINRIKRSGRGHDASTSSPNMRSDYTEIQEYQKKVLDVLKSIQEDLQASKKKK